MGVAVVCQLSLTGTAGAATAATTAKAVTTGTIAPNKANELDCNGHSPKYATVRSMAATCADPVKVVNGKRLRFEDNENYIGHDEPSVKFISSTPGSGNTMTYLTRIPVDPKKSPTASGSVTNYGELSVAPWFGLPMCDPLSFPQGACTPDSDTNNPNVAGSAFMELQVYPPGYTPFVNSMSCSKTQWCAALNIDSLECNAAGACNNNCIEPVNFSYLQTNGVPPGPPNPQQTDVSTFLPNAHTLKINGGDLLQVSITDPPQGFTTTIRDLTTHQTGTMTASAANGFANTNMSDCSGVPHTFHAEYSTAAQQNQVPWAALEGGVLMQQEIGHAEVCNSVTNKDPFTFTGGSQTYTDPKDFDTCVGGPRARRRPVRGRATRRPASARTRRPRDRTGRWRARPTTRTAVRCASSPMARASRRAPARPRSTASPVTEVSAANFCLAGRYQNGDLDFDGTDYVPNTWPNGTRNHPTAFQYAGPFLANGKPYPQIQFETNVGASEALCNTTTGAGCAVPPAGAKFYPFWSLSPPGLRARVALTSCAWNFGNVLPNTIRTFGKDAEYGVPNVARFAGTSTSPVHDQPAVRRILRRRPLAA